MGKPKKALAACKARGEKIIGIYNTKTTTADVTEFLQTMKFANSVFEDYINAKSKYRPKISDEGARLEQLVKTYEDLLVHIVSTGRFLRYFTSNRVRKNLDNINSQLFKEVTQISNALKENKIKNSKKSKKKKPESTTSEIHTDCIKDEDARRFWEQHFQQSIMAEWGQFVNSLRI
eukprot:TRINITY_DN5580_c0_g2_i1.p1 TRINITY_DN5580_c0_g2~~TRINITY_DN5580_c0_g2_i1.p1  ORF type:complete len:186 (-),score=41.88 TRINITY_DN5580_c0_g2_i1:15-542(-)